MSNQKNSHDFHRLGEIYEVAGHCLLNTQNIALYQVSVRPEEFNMAIIASERSMK
jgi:hypothetical protein